MVNHAWSPLVEWANTRKQANGLIRTLIVSCIEPCGGGQRAYRASAGVVVLEVLPLKITSNLLELRHAVLLALPESSTFGISLNAQRADPMALWHLLQRRVQAKEVAAPIALVAQYDLRFVMATFAQLTVEGEDVVRHSNAHGAGLQLQSRLQGSVPQISAEDRSRSSRCPVDDTQEDFVVPCRQERPS